MKLSLKRVLNHLMMLATLIGLGACGFPDKNIDPVKNNVQVHRQDMKDCALAYPETPDGVYLKRRVGCMELKGWQ
jgi:predicted small lipoprotein YifL